MHGDTFSWSSKEFSQKPVTDEGEDVIPGGDAAGFLARKLRHSGFNCEILDQAWGWKLIATKVDTQVVEVGVSLNQEASEAEMGVWNVVVDMFRINPIAGFFPPTLGGILDNRSSMLVDHEVSRLLSDTMNLHGEAVPILFDADHIDAMPAGGNKGKELPKVA